MLGRRHGGTGAKRFANGIMSPGVSATTRCASAPMPTSASVHFLSGPFRPSN